MEQVRNKFPHDQDNRIRKLYYDVNINTIFNRTKLQNVKNKFWKYLHYLEKDEPNNMPKLLELQTIRDGLYIQLQRAKKDAFIHNPIHESHKKRDLLVPLFNEADDNYEEMKCYCYLHDVVIDDILDKITEIRTQQTKIKHYKKCAHCEKMDMVTISGCTSNHKLCSDCIYDKTECPVCNEELDLVHCDICLEYKKELVDTGCGNKHQTCKNCLVKIKQKNNLCPFCRGSCSSDRELLIDFEMRLEAAREQQRYIDIDSDRFIEDNDDITMHMENLISRYPSRRYANRDARREEDEEEEDRRDRMEDRRESMRERAREHRANATR